MRAALSHGSADVARQHAARVLSTVLTRIAPASQVLHDGMLLMDRAAAAGALAVDGPAAPLAAAACLMLACQHQGELCGYGSFTCSTPLQTSAHWHTTVRCHE